MSEPRFVHLRLHSDYSLTDGIVRYKELVKQCQAQGQAAVALTDNSNLFALVKFYEMARAAGIKPIIGADLWLEGQFYEEPLFVTALIQNHQGYRNLILLISRAWQHNQHQGRAIVKREWLVELSEGLIWLTGNSQSELGRLLLNGDNNKAKQLAQFWQTLCPERFYLEVMRTSRQGDEDCLHACVALADEMNLPLVATNDVRFLHQEDFEAHEARVCIHDSETLEDPRRVRRYSEEQYLKTPEQMLALFDDCPMPAPTRLR